ncbi:histidine-rich glycoprotein isoform X2 [Microcaecilia unicolor]|uniref:Histidine-rich glycoprotein n=1 Tax=Microcaecilia unicolor TaxID=1415580 RepID=A0A6P7ZAV1_9AMPH|nr:histidine-rich glycoprotein-like isoform X1 [Microcaecilia unicolor]XP_030072789.1 histidine-rich glycoprotein-like isoform X2 [Microcaecilia unicolor]
MKLFTALLTSMFFSLSSALTPESVLPANCSAVFPAAVKALDWINKVQEEGYILSLFRIADAHEQQVINGAVYYLTMDVVETKCPVVIKKHWLDCQIAPYFLTRFGQCKLIIYINNDQSTVQLYHYNCTISPVPSQLISSTCPACPTVFEDGREDFYLILKAKEGLEQYNGENNFTNYFKFDKIEKVSRQIIDAPMYTIEFIVRETNCSKSLPDVNVSKCHFLENKPAIGFCIANSSAPDVTVSCEIYNPKEDHPEDPDVDSKDCRRTGHKHEHGHRHEHDRGHKHGHRHEHGHSHGHRHRHEHGHRHRHEHGHRHGHECRRRHGHRKCHRPHHHHHHHHHPHTNGHNNTQPEGKELHHEHKHECRPPPGHGYNATRHERLVSYDSSSEEHGVIKASCWTKSPSGAMLYLSLQNEFDVLPVPIIPNQPELFGSSDGITELPGPGEPGEKLLPCRALAIQPFPLKLSDSESCPEQPREFMPEILHLFPK